MILCKMIPMIMGIANATADAGKTGFAVMHSEDMTARWQEYYIDAVWRGEEYRHEQRGKCEYRMLICGKE